MDNLSVHARDLLFHFGDLLLSGADVSLQLLDLVVKHELELLKLLRFLLQLIYSHHFISDRLLSLLDLLWLRDLLLKVLLVLLLYLLDIL